MSLELITTEKFGDLDCDFYKNLNDEILLTREQIGNALEYTHPNKSIEIIHRKHKDRLEDFSVTIKLMATDGKSYDTCLYTEKGVMEICRWSRQPKANLFMDFTWDVMDRTMHKQPMENLQDLSLKISQYTSTISTELSSIKSDVQFLTYNYYKQQTLKKYSKWKSKTSQRK